MQEIVLILSSIAGVATAAALRKIPKPRNPILHLGANSQIIFVCTACFALKKLEHSIFEEKKVMPDKMFCAKNKM